jgi:hypothetical protein
MRRAFPFLSRARARISQAMVELPPADAAATHRRMEPQRLLQHVAVLWADVFLLLAAAFEAPLATITLSPTIQSSQRPVIRPARRRRRPAALARVVGGS